MANQRDEARQQGGSASETNSPTRGNETTGATMLQQSAAPGASGQFGSGDGHDQQSQRGVGTSGAKPPKELLKDTAEDLKREAGEVARAASRQVESLADEQRTRASSYIETLASAMQSASQTLEQQGCGGSARTIDQIGEQIREFSQMMRSRDPKQLVDDVSGFARQNPALFLGASMMAGFGLARFIKSGVVQGSSQSSSSGDTP